MAFNGSDVVSCRMYRNFKEIWEGFSKNLFAALGYSTPGLFALIGLIACTLYCAVCISFHALLVSEFTLSLFWLPLAQIAVALLCRLFIALIFRQSLPMAFLHVLSQVVLLAIACNSFYQYKIGKGARLEGEKLQFYLMEWRIRGR